jgi:2-dehydropantoate 2-reductase
MRILILGAGAIGGYFGARLAAAGVDVMFLARSARAKRLEQDGIVLLSPLGDVRQPVAVVTEAAEPFDAALLTCKAYDLASAMDAIAPAVGPQTLILPLLNGLKHLDDLDARFGAERVLGGLCALSATLTETGEIRHLNRLQRFVFGPRSPVQAAACGTLRQELSRGGFAPILSPNILQDMWEKYVFLATAAGMTCLMRAPIGRILQADEGETLMLEMLEECVGAASASGHAPRPESLADARAMLTQRGSNIAASMLRDIERGGPTEGEHILGDMLARARRAGATAPLLRVARAHVQIYEASRAPQGASAALRA